MAAAAPAVPDSKQRGAAAAARACRRNPSTPSATRQRRPSPPRATAARPGLRPARQAGDHSDYPVSIVMWARMLLEEAWPHTTNTARRGTRYRSSMRNPEMLVPRTTARKGRDRRFQACRRVAQHPHDAGGDDRFSAVGRKERQDKADGLAGRSSTAMCTAAAAAAPPTSAVAARARAPP